jgi:carbon monoxide dehydrogenase subunit G
MELEGAPIAVTMWIQMLPSDEATSRLKVTLGAELNFFIRKMIESKIEKASEGLAQFLSQIPY